MKVGKVGVISRESRGTSRGKGQGSRAAVALTAMMSPIREEGERRYADLTDEAGERWIRLAVDGYRIWH